MSITTEPLPLMPNASEKSGSWQHEPDGILWRLVALDKVSSEHAVDVLDRHERDRAKRFRFDLDRSRYVAAHVALRTSLSDVLEQAPSEIQLTLGAEGKPALVENQDWVFNLSHSEGIALIAVAPCKHSADIGVDIEMVRDIADWQSLARENFSDTEFRDLASCREEDRAIAFLRCWTRKEACVKALGTGLTLATKGFTIGIGSDAVAVTIDVDGQSRDVEVRTLFETDNCVAALAYCPGSGDTRAQTQPLFGADMRDQLRTERRVLSNAASPLEYQASSWN